MKKEYGDITIISETGVSPLMIKLSYRDALRQVFQVAEQEKLDLKNYRIILSTHEEQFGMEYVAITKMSWKLEPKDGT